MNEKRVEPLPGLSTHFQKKYVPTYFQNQIFIIHNATIKHFYSDQFNGNSMHRNKCVHMSTFSTFIAFSAIFLVKCQK